MFLLTLSLIKSSSSLLISEKLSCICIRNSFSTGGSAWCKMNWDSFNTFGLLTKLPCLPIRCHLSSHDSLVGESGEGGDLGGGEILRELAATQRAFVLLSSVSITDVVPHAWCRRGKVGMCAQNVRFLLKTHQSLISLFTKQK